MKINGITVPDSMTEFRCKGCNRPFKVAAVAGKSGTRYICVHCKAGRDAAMRDRAERARA